MNPIAPLHVVFIDNYDSFVFNLVDDFARRGCEVSVWRNDTPVDQVLSLAHQAAPRLLVISPGPGTPQAAGCCLEVLRQAPAQLPIFGVCLGHQAIIEAYGGTVGRAPQPVHGQASGLSHDARGLFASIPSPMSVGRYHSLVGITVPDDLRVTAGLEGLPMSVAHKSRPIWGVQFHPESILTPQGGLLIDNLIRLARTSNVPQAADDDIDADTDVSEGSA